MHGWWSQANHGFNSADGIAAINIRSVKPTNSWWRALPSNNYYFEEHDG